jgi:hypothetical protein
MGRPKTENRLSWFQKNRFADGEPCYISGSKVSNYQNISVEATFIGLLLEEK